MSTSTLMSTKSSGVMAVFSYLDKFCGALEKVRDRSDFHGFEAFSPTSYHEIEHAMHFDPSPVRKFTLIGGLTGVTTGFALALGLDYNWPIVVGGKPAGVFSIPAYVVIGFELTILLGAICTIAGMLIMGRIPNPKLRVLDPRTTDDKFAIYVPGATVDGPQAKLLRELGAEEINATQAP
jgi:hypothetical protein